MNYEDIATLQALIEHQTMSRVSSHLNISQSTVSKRISRLEKTLGIKLIEPDGRQVRPTSTAIEFLNEIAPAFHTIKSVVSSYDFKSDNTVLTFSCSESIISSHLADAFNIYLKDHDPYVRCEVDHNPITFQKVQAGSVCFGINSPPEKQSFDDVIIEPLIKEAYYLIGDSKQVHNDNFEKPVGVLSVNTNTPASRYLKKQMAKCKLYPLMEIDSFLSILTLAKAGVAPAVVPECMLNHLSIIDKTTTMKLPFQRTISLIYRKNSLKHERIKHLINHFRHAIISTQNI